MLRKALLLFVAVCFVLVSCTNTNSQKSLLGSWGREGESDKIKFFEDYSVEASFLVVFNETFEVLSPGIKIIDEIKGQKIDKWKLIEGKKPCDVAIEINGKIVWFDISQLSVQPWYTDVKQVKQKGEDKVFFYTKSGCYYEKIPFKSSVGNSETIYIKQRIGILNVKAQYRFSNKREVEIYVFGKGENISTKIVIATLYITKNQLKLEGGEKLGIKKGIYNRIIQKEKITVVGTPASDFELMDTNGNLWKLSDLKGKVVFINFWATWDPGSKAEMPYKKSLNERMQGMPFQMLGIPYKDNPQDVRVYIKKYGITIPTLISPKDEVARLYGVTGAPESFIIDKNGIVREKIIGPRVWDSQESIALIEKWL